MTKANVPVDEKFIVTPTELSHIFKLSGSDLRRLKGEGLPVMAKKGPKGGQRYYLRDVVSWYIDRMQLRADEDNENLNLEQERARQASASADKMYLDVAKAKRELVRIDLIQEPVRQFAKILSDTFTALPARLKQRLPSLTSTELDLVRTECARLQNECAEIPNRMDL